MEVAVISVTVPTIPLIVTSWPIRQSLRQFWAPMTLAARARAPKPKARAPPAKNTPTKTISDSVRKWTLMPNCSTPITPMVKITAS